MSSVELDPPELGFKRPFTQEVSQVLRLRNPNSDPVAFKVKTTAPKQYCVRPNSGRIEPGRDVEVQVLLQAMKEDPPPDARCRDKFLVQSVAVNAAGAVGDAGSDGNVSRIWSNIEQNAKSSIQERKIRVNFLPADGGAAATTNGIKEDDQAPPPAYSSPSPSNAATPLRQSATSDAARDASTPDTSTFGSTIVGGATSTASAVSAAVPSNQDELKQQYEQAKAEIARLQAQLAEGLRQRKPQETAQKAAESVKQSMQNAPAPGGVPVQIVAALCLLCFVIAWLFF